MISSRHMRQPAGRGFCAHQRESGWHPRDRSPSTRTACPAPTLFHPPSRRHRPRRPEGQRPEPSVQGAGHRDHPAGRHCQTALRARRTSGFRRRSLPVRSKARLIRALRWSHLPRPAAASCRVRWQRSGCPCVPEHSGPERQQVLQKSPVARPEWPVWCRPVRPPQWQGHTRGQTEQLFWSWSLAKCPPANRPAMMEI